MKGRETAPINDATLATLLGLPEIVPLQIILGVPEDKESLKKKTFARKVQKSTRKRKK